MTASYEAITLRDGYDLNVLTKPGLYMVTDPSNGPDTGDWYVEVRVSKIGGNARQIQHAWNDADASGQARTFTGTAGWGSWISIGNIGSSDTLAVTGDISPAQLTASVDDYAPTGLSGASVVRLDADAGTYNITGLTTGGDGRVVMLLNVGTNDITITNEDASSTAANRFALDGNVVLRAGAGLMVIYDTVSSRWRQVMTRQTDFQNVVLETFTASGTWTKDTGLVAANVIVIGGGGAGGGAAATSGGQNSVGGGGGAGGIAIESFVAADLGATETVTIGVGGTGASGTTGGNGGTSSFGALCSATGGSGGSTSAAASGESFAAGGSGGEGSGGDLNIRGTQGGIAHTAGGGTAIGYAGVGGDSEYGGGGESPVNTSAAGNAGQGNGSGGSGAKNAASLSAKAGGNGTAGIVIVAEYY